MQGPTDEAFVPMKSYVIDSRILGVTMRRKNGTRTMPVPAEEENPVLPPLPPPPPPPPPLPEDEDIPAAPRLQALTSFSTATDGVTTDPSDDTPRVPVSLAAALPSAAAPRAPGRRWKGEEDGKLTEAVKKHGNDWVAVAAMVPGRTNDQCNLRWTKSLDPSGGKKKGKWKPEEDAKLTEAVKKHGKNWVAVAAQVPGRSNKQCHKRWTDVLDPSNNGKKAGKWKAEEDGKLTEAVKKHGNDWVAVAALVPGQTNYQCRRRWNDVLNPSNNASSTVEEEHNDRNDEALVDGYIGNDEALV
jgi:hypothetical protein